MSSSELSELITKVREVDTACFSQYLYLLETVCGTSLFSKEKVIAVVGESVFDTLNMISDVTFFNYADIYLEIRQMEEHICLHAETDTSAFIIKLKHWLDKMKIACAGAITKMAILQNI